MSPRRSGNVSPCGQLLLREKVVNVYVLGRAHAVNLARSFVPTNCGTVIVSLTQLIRTGAGHVYQGPRWLGDKDSSIGMPL